MEKILRWGVRKKCEALHDITRMGHDGSGYLKILKLDKFKVVSLTYFVVELCEKDESNKGLFTMDLCTTCLS
jgi:hypothetical protein